MNYVINNINSIRWCHLFFVYYYCNNNIHMYLNILSFDNFITSSITYHSLSMEFKFMISLEIFM